MTVREQERCLEEDEALGFIRGQLSDKAVTTLEAHLESCADCRRLVLALAKASASRAPTLASSGHDSSRTAVLGTGDSVGRYLITEILGAGSMGVVYGAYDPKLHRRLALKLLRHEGEPGQQSHQRLVREAQALARLAHPSVVTIHDVGTENGQVFLAMEFCSGGTLREWLDTEQPRQAEILQCFEAAGEGLAAAHQQGLIHRDFKPANILLTGEGWAKVTDFGLACLEGQPDETSKIEDGVLGSSITKTGALMGTPAYMAPEQLRGEQATQRSDQFSFCVALWEALCRQRPFEGATLAELLVSMQAGPSRNRVGSGRDVHLASDLRKALQKGLSFEPGHRFATMAELLEAIGTQHRKAFSRRVAFAGAALVVATGLWSYTRITEPGDTCAGSDRHLAESWNAEQRAAMRRAFAGSSLPRAEATWSRIEESMGRYAGEWVLAHRESCKATKVYGEQSPERMDLQMNCLRRLKDDFAGLSGVFAEADAQVVAHSLAMVSELSNPEECSDVDSLGAGGAMPVDPRLRQSIQQVERDLANAEALESAGAYQRAFDATSKILSAATALEQRATVAEVLLARGRMAKTLGKLELSESTLQEALLAAESGSHSGLRAPIWLALARTIGVEAARLEEGLRLGRQAYAIAEGQGGKARWVAEALLVQSQILQQGGDYEQAEQRLSQATEVLRGSDEALPLLRAALASARGKLAHVRGRLDEAQREFEGALQSMSNSLGHAHPEVAAAHMNLGSIFKDKEQNKQALEHYERARELWSQALGSDHVDVGRVLGNIGLVHMETGAREQALEEHQASLAILQSKLGDEHPNVGLQLNNVGLTLIYLGRAEESLSYLERSKALFANIQDEHERMAVADSNLGLAYRYLGKLELASQYYAEAVARFEKHHGSTHPEVARGLSQMALIQIISEHYDAAEPLLKRAIAAFSETVGPESHSVAANTLDLGWVQLQRGNLEEAKRNLEKAVLLFEKLDGTDYYRSGSAHFELAKLLWGNPSERTRSRELALQAQREFEKAGERRAGDAADVVMWLAKHKLAD